MEKFQNCCPIKSKPSTFSGHLHCQHSNGMIRIHGSSSEAYMKNCQVRASEEGFIFVVLQNYEFDKRDLWILLMFFGNFGPSVFRRGEKQGFSKIFLQWNAVDLNLSRTEGSSAEESAFESSDFLWRGVLLQISSQSVKRYQSKSSKVEWNW